MKKLRGTLRLIFGRTTFLLLFLLIQIFILFGTFRWLRDDVIIYAFGGFTVLSAIVVIYILNTRKNPSFKLSWIIPILIIPVFGTLCYLFVQLEIGTKLIASRARALIKETQPFVGQNEAVIQKLRTEDMSVANLVHYMNDYGGYPIHENTYAKYFPSGEEKFKQLVLELEQARKFIFMEYFIVERGLMWDTLLEILERKVKEGVEVRFMYDGMCSLTLLPYRYSKVLKAKGLKTKIFAPIKPALSTSQNNRDHRKIVVIDGHTAFTGGINLADEYINEKERFGYWKDTAIMIKGDGVRNFTVMFLQMWNISEKQPENYSAYMDVEIPPDVDRLDRSGYIMPYGDSPLDLETVGENIYIDILYHAKRYVHIMTPYLILDNDMVMALTYAAKRGIETSIIMPHIPDKVYAYLLARSYYQELIDAGVKIYEFTPGFIHAKVFVSDDEKAVVGTINLDYRSLYLNFECGAYLYKNTAIHDVELDYQETLKKCQLITSQDCKNYPLLKKIGGSALRLFAPLM